MSNTLNLNGSVLSLASLALIAEMLERGGEVVVRNCAIQSDAPVAKSLGFEVFREERDGYWHTQVEQIETRDTAIEFSTPITNIGPPTRALTPRIRIYRATLERDGFTNGAERNDAQMYHNRMYLAKILEDLLPKENHPA